MGPRKSRSFPIALKPARDSGENVQVLSLLRAASFHLRGPEGGRIVNWDQPHLACRLLDVSDTNLPRTQKALTELLTPAEQRQRSSLISGLTEDGTRYQLEYSLTDSEGQQIWLSETGERLSGNGQCATHIIAVIRDISDQKTQNEYIKSAPNLEPISGLMSEQAFNNIITHISNSLPKSKVIRTTFSNRQDMTAVYGHTAIEHLIRAMAKRLRGEISPKDLACHDGGDSFLIFLPGQSAEALLERSKKLAYIFDELPFETPFGTLYPDCKISIESAPAVSVSSRRDSEHLPSLSPANRTQAEITELDILLALDQNKFDLALQPICRAGSRHPEYFEALLRIRDEAGHLSTAFPFIRAAEHFGMISGLDLRAIALAKAILRKDPNIRLSVNISVGTLNAPKSFEAYLAEIESLGSDASRLVVELTETMALDNLEIANLFAAKLQSYGVKMAIDDFGAGHTSFNNLLGLEAQVIKIDGRYIRDIAASLEKQNFVRLLAEMAEVFGLISVAEMIDNEADARTVERLGVHYLQGYYLGRPAPV